MSGLRPPPSTDTPSRIFGRFAVLIILLLLLGAFIWSAVILQQIPLVEDTTLESVEVGGSETIDGVRFHVQDQGINPTATFLFHDIEISGLAAFDGLVAALGDDVRTVAVDLPGFGLTTRFPEKGADHTVGRMAERMIGLIEARTSLPALLVGVGLGGEVAAEIAVLRPDLVAALVMIDTDYYNDGGWVQTAEGIPWMGLAFTYAFETSGAFAGGTYAPHCEDDGWCPTPDQAAARSLAASIEGTSESVHAFRTTPPASNVPSRLVDITAPAVFVWSQKGTVPKSSVDRVIEAIPGLRIEQFDDFQAHLEDPGRLAELIRDLLG